MADIDNSSIVEEDEAQVELQLALQRLMLILFVLNFWIKINLS